MSDSEHAVEGYIITFPSSHFALKAEKKIKKQQLTEQITLISAPRSISSECGFCLLLDDYPHDDLFERLSDMNLNFHHIYIKKTIDGVKTYAKSN
ncbi:DUF3343 domain-containing protein [Aliivibrio kagoshimensis]|uniref:DUF3343 domain-containing protein n=1 Tax=Aliivibrio kagoshimensis TaxID=2910230 RepID=UPI003D0DCA88